MHSEPMILSPAVVVVVVVFDAITFNFIVFNDSDLLKRSVMLSFLLY